MLRSLCLSMLCASTALAAFPTIEDSPFIQEYHEPYVVPDDEDANDVNAVSVDKEGRVWTASRAGVHVLEDGRWFAPDGAPEGFIFDVLVDAAGKVWIASWNGLYVGQADGITTINEVRDPISALGPAPYGVVAIGPSGLWTTETGSWTKQTGPWPQAVYGIEMDPTGALWIATGLGLYHKSAHGDRLYYKQPDELQSGLVRSLAFDREGRLWVGELGGIDVLDEGGRVKQFSTKEGLPDFDVRSLAFDAQGTLWAGTAHGVARFDGKTWSLRHSRRWLLSDDVRDIAIDADGTAWVATSSGVSAIRSRKMTLADKADYISAVTHERHVRDPWIVEHCNLEVPGDLSTWKPDDDDNDGSYTGVYMISQCFRYAATKDPRAKANADKAFDTIELLQSITQTPGFIARTIIPSSWTTMHDVNEEISPETRAVRLARDPRYKQVEVRWRPSADGKWLWKGDTSSDEITGHYYGFWVYYNLAANEAQKERVRDLARKMMDHIIAGGLNLNDIDGEHTRWGVWAPDKLNHDPNWRAERGINSAEILMFLKVTHALTGDRKYQDLFLELIKEHGYAENARHAKTYHPSERTHIDDELLAFTYPGLILYENDPALKSIFQESLEWWFIGLRKDENPYFTFNYASLGGEDITQDLVDQAAEFLRDAPLDLIEWTVDNSRREDITLLRSPEIDPLQTNRMLPASERAVMRWDKNPWVATAGNNGRTESSGVYWLLAYWMGRYHGFISAPN